MTEHLPFLIPVAFLGLIFLVWEVRLSYRKQVTPTPRLNNEDIAFIQSTITISKARNGRQSD